MFGTVTYSIWSGDEEGIFLLELTSGQLSVDSGAGLDYNKQDVYTLMIRATDGWLKLENMQDFV